MTIEQIWKQYGMGAHFYCDSRPDCVYIICGRWQYGILYNRITLMGNSGKKSYRLNFLHEYNDYNFLPSSELHYHIKKHDVPF